MPVAVDEFQRLLALLTTRLGADITALLTHATPRLSQRELLAFLTDAYPDLLAPYEAAAGELTAQYYLEQPSTTTDFTAVTAVAAPAEQLSASARWAALQPHPITALQGSASRAVMAMSRNTVLHNVAREPGARWARHASANACGFCRLLATRGAVYRSEASAGTVTGRSVNLELADRRMIAAGTMTRDQALESRSTYRSARQARKRGKNVGDQRIGAQRGTRGHGDKYHDHCHCIAVPVRPGDNYEPPPYVEQWNADYLDASGGNRTPAQIANAMDKAAGGRRDSAKGGQPRIKGVNTEQNRPATAAGRGGGTPPPTPPNRPSAAGPAGEEPGWSGHLKGYRHPHNAPIWTEAERVRRQSALKVIPRGEQLHQHEIETVERLQAAGQTVRWLPKDTKTYRPTNDIEWADRGGIQADLKATGPKYTPAAQLIRTAVIRARAAQVIKDTFIVDLGPARLTTKLRAQLGKYNLRNPNNTIRELWVISRGELIQIGLEQ